MTRVQKISGEREALLAVIISSFILIKCAFFKKETYRSRDGNWDQLDILRSAKITIHDDIGNFLLLFISISRSRSRVIPSIKYHVLRHTLFMTSKKLLLPFNCFSPVFDLHGHYANILILHGFHSWAAKILLSAPPDTSLFLYVFTIEQWTMNSSDTDLEEKISSLIIYLSIALSFRKINNRVEIANN